MNEKKIGFHTNTTRPKAFSILIVAISIAVCVMVYLGVQAFRKDDAVASHTTTDTINEAMSSSSVLSEQELTISRLYKELSDATNIIEILTIGQNQNPDLRKLERGVMKLSADEKFIYITRGIGDMVSGFVYDINTKTSHHLNINNVSTVKPATWLEDGRLELYSGCVSAEYCKHYISADRSTPWILEEVSI